MTSIEKLPYLNDKISSVIKQQTSDANTIWKDYELDERYKEGWINSNVKLYCCYYFVIEWFNSELEDTYVYNEQLCEILEACKKEYVGINGSRMFPITLYEPKKLLKHYIYKKCELLLNEY